MKWNIRYGYKAKRKVNLPRKIRNWKRDYFNTNRKIRNPRNKYLKWPRKKHSFKNK